MLSRVPDHSIAIAAGQVLVGGFEGTTVPPSIDAAIAQGQLGGLILFKRNIEGPAEVQAMLRACQSKADVRFPLLIGVDQEGGRVSRLSEPVIQLPAMRQFGRWDDPALTQRAARVLATQLRHLGFTINFAPVLDVDSNPDNPVIGDRAFGSDASVVVRHGAAFIQGMRQAGLLNCGKHFPGHGDTVLDSHEALPRLEHSLEQLKAVELVPFRALAPELDAVMSAHIIYRAIDAAHPATLSPTILQSILRDYCGFRGCLISDDLEMKAISLNYTVPEAAYQAILAGCDALLICRNTDLVWETREYLQHQAQGDAAFAERLFDAAKRFVTLRQRVQIQTPTSTDLSKSLESPEVTSLRRELEARLQTP